MTPCQQQLWDHAARHAYKETAKINDGQFDELFYRVALDYYSILLTDHVKKTIKEST
jgi:hypothetical protein